MEKKRHIILATGNTHKVTEFDGLLCDLGIRVDSAAVCGGMPEVAENRSDFAGNAELKARALAGVAPANAWVLADDSGLEVEALGGAPGIYSARYAGAGAGDEANVAKLLWALQGMPPERRGARFRCLLCLLREKGGCEFFEGVCPGRVAEEPAGAGGFGYDPVFIPEGYERTFAELGEAVKARLSHRANAVLALRNALS